MGRKSNDDIIKIDYSFPTPNTLIVSFRPELVDVKQEVGRVTFSKASKLKIEIIDEP